VSGTFQSTPNADRIITCQVTRTLVPTLSQTSVNVRLNEPGSVYNDRVNPLDVSIARSFRTAVGAKTLDIRPELGIYNMLNANPVLAQLNVYGATLGNVTSIVNPRVFRLGLTVKF
jgi:hypothetical protein